MVDVLEENAKGTTKGMYLVVRNRLSLREQLLTALE